MAEEKGKVVLFGTRWSRRANVAKMLVSGELKACSLEPTDSNSECETYVGRGWTVVDTMGFGQPLGGIVPDEYVTKMVIDFLNEVKGRYSHIIFVVDRDDFRLYSEGVEFMWRTFLETFKGGEENFVVLVTNETPEQWEWAWTLGTQRRMVEQNELDARIKKMFPECKHFLYFDLGDSDPKMSPNDGHAMSGHAMSRIEALEKLEKEMEEMFTAADCSWVVPEISEMGDAEIQETTAKISSHLTSSLAIQPRQWGWPGSACEPIKHYECLMIPPSAIKKATNVLIRVRDEMQNLHKEVKFFPRQCAYLLQRSMGASKLLQDLVGGTVEAILDDEDDHLAPLLTALDKLDTCTEAASKLLQLCGDSEKEHEVALALSSRPLPGTTGFQVSKFALVIRDLEWSLDALCFVLHNPEAQRASTESERQSWLSKFLWCESRRRLVYVGDGEDKAVVESSTRAADNDRQAEDQRDLISAMESHFTTFPNPRKVVPRWFIGEREPQLLSSEIVSYMSILRNRLHGDASFNGDSSMNTVPECFRIQGKQEYKAVKLIGEGSYKQVHKCNWLGMNVAIATESQRNGHSRQGSDDFRTIFEVEAGLLARVQHPNVVTFLGYGYDEKNQRGFQVSELMESSLRSLINKGYRSKSSFYPFTVSQVIDILLQIVEAMIHVHECGVIYRDLKIDNCLANRKLDQLLRGYFVAVVKLIDFGTSELQSPEMGCHFNTPNKGSLPWMAPELYKWPGEEVKLYTWSADVYSFGMTCYEVVTGELPFQGISSSPRWLREAVRNGLRPTIPSNCPGELRELMTKCWAHSPEDRPTFKEIRENLWRSRLYYTIWKTHSDQQAIDGRKRFCGLMR